MKQLIVLFFITTVFSGQLCAQEKETVYYKYGYKKINNPKKADFSITTYFTNDIKTVEYRTKNKKKPTRISHYNKEGEPVGLWKDKRGEKDYSFTLEKATKPEMEFDSLPEVDLKNFRYETQKAFHIPRSIAISSKKETTYTSKFFIHVKNKKIHSIKSSQSSGSILLDKEGARILRKLDVAKLIPDNNAYYFEMPIIIKIR